MCSTDVCVAPNKTQREADTGNEKAWGVATSHRQTTRKKPSINNKQEANWLKKTYRKET
jgi:hypothetical protein